MNSPVDGARKLAVAQEVIVSAGNILAAAGFQRDEIAEFFRQAAGQLGSVAGRKDPVQPVREVRAAPSVAEMLARFAEIAPVRALIAIAVDPIIVAGLRDGSEPAQPHIDPALQMLPQIAEAQNWLRDLAQEAGLIVAANRQQWLAKAPPEAQEQVGQMLFLDDFEPAYKPCFDFLTALAAAVVRENDEEALNALLQGLVEWGVIVNYDLKVQMETGVEKLKIRD